MSKHGANSAIWLNRKLLGAFCAVLEGCVKSSSCRIVFGTMICVGMLVSGPVAAGPGVNQFEVKDLESDPGELQFQSQNAISFGQPKRQVRETAPGVFAFDDNTIARERYALEMQMGLTTWFRMRLGIEFEKERTEEPGSLARANAFDNLSLAGIALEGVAVVVPIKGNGIGLGFLAELDQSVGSGGAHQIYAGPIVQAVYGPWSALANLMIVQHLGSSDVTGETPADRKRDFAYAAQLQYTVSPTWALALEGYGTIDRLGTSGTPPPERALFGDHDQHRLGPIVYYRFDPSGKPLAGVHKGGGKSAIKSAVKDDDDGKGGDDDKGQLVSIGVGVLFGLNNNTPSETLKLSLEYNF